MYILSYVMPGFARMMRIAFTAREFTCRAVRCHARTSMLEQRKHTVFVHANMTVFVPANTLTCTPYAPDTLHLRPNTLNRCFQSRDLKIMM